MKIAIAVALLAASTAAAAGPLDKPFAALAGIAVGDIIELQAFELDGGPFNYLAVARYKRGSQIRASAMLMKCTETTCDMGDDPFRGFGLETTTAELVAVVDLAGKPTALTGRITGSTHGTKSLAVAKLAWPALVVRSTATGAPTSGTSRNGRFTGSERNERWVILSLAAADAKAPRVFEDTREIRPSGTGTSATYALVAAGGKRPGRALDLRAKVTFSLEHKSHCRAPTPIPVDYVMSKARRFEAAGILENTGCR